MWRQEGSHLVIDLTYTIHVIGARIIRCTPQERWALPQDHIPILVEIDIWGGGVLQANSMRYALEKLDTKGLI